MDKTIYNAENMKDINKRIHGNQLSKLAKSLPLMKKLMMKVSRFLGKNMIQFDNNATLYYDQIVAAMRSLVSQAYGLPK